MKKYTFLTNKMDEKNYFLYPLIYNLAKELSSKFLIRNGEATLIDKEIKKAVESEGEFIIPSRNFNQSDSGYVVDESGDDMLKKAKSILKETKILPWIDQLRPEHQIKHISAVFLILGMYLDDNSNFVISYNNGNDESDYINTALAVAKHYNITVRDIKNEEEFTKICEMLNKDYKLYNNVKLYLKERIDSQIINNEKAREAISPYIKYKVE